MKANIVCQIQNSMGRFIHYYIANTLDRISIELLYQASDTSLIISSLASPVIGFDNIQAAMNDLQDRRARSSDSEFHLLHTPACTVSNNGLTAYASWDTYSYGFQSKSEKITAQMYITRINAVFIFEHDSWKILRLEWREMQSLLPWNKPAPQDLPAIASMPHLPTAAVNFSYAAEDWLNIRNVQGFLCCE